MQKTDRPKAEKNAIDPGIASFVATVRQFEKQLLSTDEPAQFVRTLEEGAKTGNDNG
jgi:hypothetical protein